MDGIREAEIDIIKAVKLKTLRIPLPKIVLTNP